MRSRVQRGFTLVEVLVALSIMAVMGVMSWRGIDSIRLTQSALEERSTRIRTIQTALAQWRVDLDHQTDDPSLTQWDWDGKVLRLTRLAPSPSGELRVVAWSWQSDPSDPMSQIWVRWESAPVLTLSQWQGAWDDARAWSQSATASLEQRTTRLFAIRDMQLLVARDGSWVNPLSSAATNAAQSQGAVTPKVSKSEPPDAVRLILDIKDPALQGAITLDWISPLFTAKRS